MEFKDTYASPRHLAFERGLAQMSRGRLSREAKALIDDARNAGVLFDNETNAPAAFDPEQGPPMPVVREEVPDHLRDGHNYARIPGKGYVREPIVLYGVDVEGHKIAFTNCARCKQFSAHCECKDGILHPSYVTHVTHTEPWTSDR